MHGPGWGKAQKQWPLQEFNQVYTLILIRYKTGLPKSDFFKKQHTISLMFVMHFYLSSLIVARKNRGILYPILSFLCLLFADLLYCCFMAVLRVFYKNHIKSLVFFFICLQEMERNCSPFPHNVYKHTASVKMQRSQYQQKPKLWTHLEAEGIQLFHSICLSEDILTLPQRKDLLYKCWDAS